MKTIEVFAPAKINLTLHVIGQRADRYHLLDTLVVFADVGDLLTLRTEGGGAIRVEGPEAAHVPATDDNLVSRQALALPEFARKIDCVLEKVLPVASGIGGGSADAAAFYRGAAYIAAGTAITELEQADSITAQWQIGADVPMCIRSQPLRATGIGDSLEMLDGMPTLAAVLVNPRVPVPTAAVFRSLPRKENAPMDRLPDPGVGVGPLLDWLKHQRNDLQAPAMALVPEIAAVLAVLQDQPGCSLARMSGSGATCFGLFSSRDAAQEAAQRIATDRPDWWVRDTTFDGHLKAAPQAIRSTT